MREPKMRALVAVALLISAIPSSAAERKGAAADPPAVDDDFPYVGEYVGMLHSRENGVWRAVPVGLQVVARGDGIFEATEYFGGLPGEGWNGRDRVVLPGRRDGNVVRIDAVPVGITLDGIVGRVGTGSGSPVQGTLRRINRASPTLGRRPPKEATLVFDGSDTGCLVDPTITSDGLLCPGTETREKFQDFTLHVEFQIPYMPAASDQGRANSGVYLQRRYEVQILDSFGLSPAFNSAAAVYRTRPADVNMSFPPLVWQTYDIRFQPAAFSDGVKTANARLTVWHNGVKVHDAYELPNKTGAGREEGPDPLPILFQDHSNPVRFRNIWLVDHTRYPDVDATPKIAARNPSAGLIQPVSHAPPAALCPPH